MLMPFCVGDRFVRWLHAFAFELHPKWPEEMFGMGGLTGLWWLSNVAESPDE